MPTVKVSRYGSVPGVKESEYPSYTSTDKTLGSLTTPDLFTPL